MPSDSLMLTGVGSSVAGYALDGLPASAADYSLRRLLTSYTANKAVNIRRSSDNATQDIGFVGQNFDAASFSTFIGGGSGFAATWYDQSGNGYDLTQAVAGQQPQLLLNTLNGHPVLFFAQASNQFLSHATTPTLSQPFTLNTVAERTGLFTQYQLIVGDAGGTAGLFFDTTANNVGLYAGVAVPVAAAADNVAHSIFAVANGATSSLAVDGASAAVVTGVNSIAGIGMGSANGAAQFVQGYEAEAIIWAGSQAAIMAAVSANQKAYWGTP